jgi:hypothetical protein
VLLKTSAKQPCPSKQAPNSQEQTTAVSLTTKQPGRNEGDTAVPLKTSASYPYVYLVIIGFDTHLMLIREK